MTMMSTIERSARSADPRPGGAYAAIADAGRACFRVLGGDRRPGGAAPPERMRASDDEGRVLRARFVARRGGLDSAVAPAFASGPERGDDRQRGRGGAGDRLPARDRRARVHAPASHAVRTPLLHLGLGFALAASLWTLDLLPGVSARQDLAPLYGPHSHEDTAALARELAGD